MPKKFYEIDNVRPQTQNIKLGKNYSPGKHHSLFSPRLVTNKESFNSRIHHWCWCKISLSVYHTIVEFFRLVSNFRVRLEPTQQ
jgi:hypothetical protein